MGHISCFLGKLIWLIDFWVFCPSNKFGEKVQCGPALLAQCKGIALFFVSSITNYYTVCAIVARKRIRFATFDGHSNVHWTVAHVFIPITCSATTRLFSGTYALLFWRLFARKAYYIEVAGLPSHRGSKWLKIRQKITSLNAISRIVLANFRKIGIIFVSGHCIRLYWKLVLILIFGEFLSFGTTVLPWLSCLLTQLLLHFTQV